jgi:hypothetical protein
MALKKSTVIVLMVITCFVAVNCTKDNVEDATADSGISTKTCEERNVSFQSDIEPYISATCAVSGCHNASAAAGINLIGYDKIANEASFARFMGSIKHEAGYDKMPIGNAKTSTEMIAQLECWIASGTKNN